MTVNHKLAQHYWPGQDPIGKRLRIGTPEMQTPWLTVVGEVADIKLSSPDESVEAAVLLSGRPGGGDIGCAGVADRPEREWRIDRAAVDNATGADGEFAACDGARDRPLLPLTQVQTMEEAVSHSEAPRRFNTVLIGGFALAALLLAVLGIYSVIAFSVASRGQEMAIRMALGSQRGAIIRLVLTSGAKLAVIGCLIGLAGAMAASGLLRSLLFGVSPFDPLTLTLAVVGVLLLSLTAAAPGATRRIDQSHAGAARRVANETVAHRRKFDWRRTPRQQQSEGCKADKKTFLRGD